MNNNFKMMTTDYDGRMTESGRLAVLAALDALKATTDSEESIEAINSTMGCLMRTFDSCLISRDELNGIADAMDLTAIDYAMEYGSDDARTVAIRTFVAVFERSQEYTVDDDMLKAADDEIEFMLEEVEDLLFEEEVDGLLEDEIQPMDINRYDELVANCEVSCCEIPRNMTMEAVIARLADFAREFNDDVDGLRCQRLLVYLMSAGIKTWNQGQWFGNFLQQNEDDVVLQDFFIDGPLMPSQCY